MAADALVAWITRSSAVMALTFWDKQVLVFHEDLFQVCVHNNSACHKGLNEIPVAPFTDMV